jgi:putative transposase
VKYAFIESLRQRFRVADMCRWLNLARSGFYRWRQRNPSPRAVQRETVRNAVVEVYHKFYKRYGAPRITEELNALGLACSKNHVAQILQIEGLKARNGKAFKYQPNASATYGVADNLLARNFSASRPDEKWVSDITFIDVDGEWMHLAVIMDLHSRQIIDWAVDETMTTELVLEAFQMAVSRRQVKPGLILHSDRGVQYRAGEYQDTLARHQIQCSMSRKGNCWDNAAMESFFSRLKVELVYAEDFKSSEQAYRSLFEYIEVFYNRVRRHSSLGYVSPVQFEQQYYAKCA